MLGDELYWLSPKCPLCEQLYLCKGECWGHRRKSYFEVQWHSLGQNRYATFYCFKCPPLSEFWHLGQRCGNSSSSLGVSSHRAQAKTNGACGQFVPELYPVPAAEADIWSSSKAPRDLQVGMLSHKALSVSNLGSPCPVAVPCRTLCCPERRRHTALVCDAELRPRSPFRLSNWS